MTVEYQGTASAHVSWRCSVAMLDVKALRLDVLRRGDAVQDLVVVTRPLPDPWTGTFRAAGVRLGPCAAGAPLGSVPGRLLGVGPGRVTR